MKLIDLYKEWMETGELPSTGLCNSVPKKYFGLLELFNPTDQDWEQIYKDGSAITYWGSGMQIGEDGRRDKFTPLRQTIVLLICAMCNEL